MFGRATIRLGIGPHSSLCLFCVIVHCFCLVNVCFYCVWFSFSIPSQKIGLGNMSEMTYLVSSGTYNLNSVIRGILVTVCGCRRLWDERVLFWAVRSQFLSRRLAARRRSDLLLHNSPVSGPGNHNSSICWRETNIWQLAFYWFYWKKKTMMLQLVFVVFFWAGEEVNNRVFCKFLMLCCATEVTCLPLWVVK